jgi:putative membrane protein
VADPTAAAGIAVLCLLYGRGRTILASRSAHRAAWFRPWAFSGAVAAIALALVSPLDTAVGHSLALHMVQHVLLIAVAAPLLALASPLPAVLASLPAGWRRSAMRMVRALAHPGSGRWTGRAVLATLVQAVVMWVWHAPPLFEAALHAAPLHALEHLALLGSATLAWWALFAIPRRLRGGATLVACLAAFPGTALGAALLLAPRPWYPTYAGRDGALADQQLAGVVMWAFGGFTYLVAAAGLFATWLTSPAVPSASRASVAEAG